MFEFTKWKIGGTKSISCGFMMPVLGGKLADESFVVAVGLLLDHSRCSCFTVFEKLERESCFGSAVAASFWRVGIVIKFDLFGHGGDDWKKHGKLF